MTANHPRLGFPRASKSLLQNTSLPLGYFILLSSFVTIAHSANQPFSVSGKNVSFHKTGIDLDEEASKIKVAAHSTFEKIQSDLKALGPAHNPTGVFPRYEAQVLSNLICYSRIWKTLAAASQLKDRSFANDVQDASTKIQICIDESVDVATWFSMFTNQREFRDFALATVNLGQKVVAGQRRLSQPQFVMGAGTVSDAAINAVKVFATASRVFDIAEQCSALAQAALTNFAALHESPKRTDKEVDQRFGPILKSLLQMRLKMAATLDSKNAKDFDQFVRVELALIHLQCIAEYLALRLNDLTWVEITRDALMLRDQWGKTYESIAKRIQDAQKGK